jgi:hypothetical protein
VLVRTHAFILPEPHDTQPCAPATCRLATPASAISRKHPPQMWLPSRQPPHGKLLVRVMSSTRPSAGCRVVRENCLVAGPRSRSFYSSIGFADWSKTERVSPPNHHTVECRYHGFLGQKGLVPSGFLADDLTDALHRFFDGGGRSAMVVPTAIDSHSRSVPIRESCRPLPSFCKQGVVRGHAIGKADLEPEKSIHTNYGFKP